MATFVLSLILIGGYTLPEALAQSENFFKVHFALIHLDKTEYYLGDYGAIITNIDTGEQIMNAYTDDGSRYIDFQDTLKLTSTTL